MFIQYIFIRAIIVCMYVFKFYFEKGYNNFEKIWDLKNYSLT